MAESLNSQQSLLFPSSPFLSSSLYSPFFPSLWQCFVPLYRLSPLASCPSCHYDIFSIFSKPTPFLSSSFFSSSFLVLCGIPLVFTSQTTAARHIESGQKTHYITGYISETNLFMIMFELIIRDHPVSRVWEQECDFGLLFFPTLITVHTPCAWQDAWRDADTVHSPTCLGKQSVPLLWIKGNFLHFFCVIKLNGYYRYEKTCD